MTDKATALDRIGPLPGGVDIETAVAAPLMNLLLAGLPPRARRRVIASGELVHLTLGEILCHAGARIRHVHFPIDSIISLLVPIDGHPSLEVGLVGDEGMVGLPVALGVGVSSLLAQVQGSGSALRWTPGAFRKQLKANPALRRRMYRYTYVLAAQSAQSSACISFHRLEERLARWLLMTLDRAHSDTLHLTHELLAQMLGVRRVGVTNAAGALQKHNVLTYSRGEITVLSREGLEKTTCECYEAAKDTYQRVLG